MKTSVIFDISETEMISFNQLKNQSVVDHKIISSQIQFFQAIQSQAIFQNFIQINEITFV